MTARRGTTHKTECPPPEKLAWVAGFWDGEGCITTLSTYAQLQFTLNQAGDEGEALCRRVLEWSGVNGCINGPYRVNSQKWKPYWMVRITGYIGVSVLAERCWPWLSETKKAQYELAVKRYNDYRIEHGVNDWRTRTECGRGHDLTGDNLRLTPQGFWRCRVCHREDERKRRSRRQAALGGPVPKVYHRGEANRNSRLTAADVQKIRNEWAAGGVTQADLGRRNGVSRSLIGKIIQGRVWAHLS